jgi:hypothetical protein
MTQEGQALATIESQGLTPQQYEHHLQAAHAKAALLTGIVEKQELYTEIQGKKHLHVEAWGTLAQGYGYEADIEWSRPMEGGGYEARAAIRNPLGDVVGHADAECGTQGDGKWIRSPAFQQRSMAQTRAISKALASKLRWVVVLAGYDPTPEEEMVSTQRAAQSQGALCPIPEHAGMAFILKKNPRTGKEGWLHFVSKDSNDKNIWCIADSPEVQEASIRAGAESQEPDAGDQEPELEGMS